MERKTSVLGLDFHFSYLWLYQKNGIVGTDLVQDGRIGALVQAPLVQAKLGALFLSLSLSH